MTDDNCIPRAEVAETVEALADSEHLAEQHEIGSDAEAAYVQAVSDAAEVVREWPDYISTTPGTDTHPAGDKAKDRPDGDR